MLLYSYEEDIEHVSPGNTNHNSFMVIFAGINFLNLKKKWVLINVHPCHPQQKATEKSFNA